MKISTRSFFDPGKQRWVFNAVNRLIKNKQGLIIFCILFILIIFFVYYDFIICKKIFLFKDIGSDTINISFPSLVHLSDYLRTEGLPKWSFNQGMGQNILPFSLGEPFNLILLALGRDYLAYGIVFVEIIKIFAGGLFFFLFLKEWKRPDLISVIGGLSFSFSGFMILGGTWYAFSTEAVYCPLILYSLEKYLNRGSWLLLPIPILLIASYQPFLLFPYCLLIIAYVFIKSYVSENFSFKSLFNTLMRIFGLCLIGMGISSFFLFSNVMQYIQSPRVSGEASYAGALLTSGVFNVATPKNLVTAISRFFSNDLLGTGSNFSGYKNYLEAPLLYCGLLNLLIFPQAFLFADRKRKAVFFGLIFFSIFPIIFPFFRHVFWLFTGDYYRTFSFFIMLIVLFGGVYSLNLIVTRNKLSIMLLVITFIFASIILYIITLMKIVMTDNWLLFLILVLLLLHLLVISLFKFHNLRYFAGVMLVLVFCFELGSFAHITINKRPVIKGNEYLSKTGYNDFSVDAVNYIKSIDSSFFRVNKDYSSGPAMHRSIDDAKVQGYYGTSSYDCFNQIFYIKFLAALDIIDGNSELQTKWARGLTRPLLQTLGCVKYYLTKKNSLSQENMDYSKIAKVGDVNIFKNNSYLPLGIAFNKYIFQKSFVNLPDHYKDIALLNAFVIEEGQKEDFYFLKNINNGDKPYNNFEDQYVSTIHSFRENALLIQKHSQNLIEGTITTPEPTLLMFAIPFDKGWSVVVDGEKQEIHVVDIGFMGIVLNKGFHRVRLTFSPPFFITGLIFSIISLIVFLTLIFITLERNRQNIGRRYGCWI